MEIPFEEGHDLVQKKLCRKTEISDFLKLQTEKYEGQLKQVKNETSPETASYIEKIRKNARNISFFLDVG